MKYFFEYKGYKTAQFKAITQVWCADITIPLPIAQEIGIYTNRLDWDAVRRLYRCITTGSHNDESVTIGFDCGHLTDWVPIHDDKGDEYYHRTCSHTLKEITLEYVQNECRKIIDKIEKDYHDH